MKTNNQFGVRNGKSGIIHRKWMYLMSKEGKKSDHEIRIMLYEYLGIDMKEPSIRSWTNFNYKKIRYWQNRNRRKIV